MEKGKTNTILGIKTVKIWTERYKDLEEDPELVCKACGKQGATSMPVVTWQSNMYFQVGADPVGLVRKEPEMQSILCRECRLEMIEILKESGDFFDPERA